ncbi:hypothetical protein [Gracilibacillus salinarum]|uniref:Uncharacterized protein n=1 Tax=Gracilibacillus salinarum TaxID=2932255 RepID=A0ABY4GH89_9BACI|nr:hypothetical protein [Gracilibacillus salinarum]UOQ83596.1 hypothetical protein MUN87_12605 [Gracilibacillus salinarum]
MSGSKNPIHAVTKNLAAVYNGNGTNGTIAIRKAKHQKKPTSQRNGAIIHLQKDKVIMDRL